MSAEPSKGAVERGEHVRTLDGVRGIAILVVVLHNLTLEDLAAPNAPLRLLRVLTAVGWSGVTLFFALSGYLITSILLRTRERPRYFRNFFARRVLRILPLYYVALVLVLVLAPRVLTLPGWFLDETKHQIWFWFYLSNWVLPLGLGIGVLNHFWSLAVEEQFYLAWPFVVRYVTARRLAMLCVGLAVLALASRVAIRATGFVSAVANYSWTTSRIDGLALGALVAVLADNPRAVAVIERWRGRLLVAVAVAVLGLAGASGGFGRHHPLVDTIGYSVLAVGAALLVSLAVRANARKSGVAYGIFSNAGLRWLGRYSYGIYVFHGILCLIGPAYVPEKWMHPTKTLPYLAVAYGYIAIMATISLALAYASFHLMEKRFLAMKRWFAPDGGGAAAVAPVAATAVAGDGGAGTSSSASASALPAATSGSAAKGSALPPPAR